MLMRAKYAGVCSRCSKPVAKGEEIQWVKSTRSVQCAACAEGADIDLGRMFDMAYEDQCRDACGPGL